uniref:Uncharacterized protein n=1 Tax=Ananas comosus var. bracteatus TaxID=296719 RepID=A0A6V7QT01_ANACO
MESAPLPLGRGLRGAVALGHGLRRRRAPLLLRPPRLLRLPLRPLPMALPRLRPLPCRPRPPLRLRLRLRLRRRRRDGPLPRRLRDRGLRAHVDRRRGYTELWWRPGEMRGHVWLDEAPAGPWPATSPPYRVSADASRFGNRASAARIARIAAEAYRAASDPDSGWGGGEAARWFVMGDDDTVFFPENLVGVLGKYDHEEMYYIGAPSESVEQDVMHSYAVAFGGAGFAISYPAAAELARIIDACLQRYTNFYGSDERVSSCLSELGIPLTLEPGFHQVDVRGDAYGMLAAHPIAPLVSLHHSNT